MFRFTELVYLVAGWSSLAAAHTVIVYPGWRGNNIITNGTVASNDPSIIPGSLGITHTANGSTGFPYGMQWMYPCGGMPTSQNRTKWPIKGGAVSLQPGWFPGHALAQIYINLGYGNEPLNFSHVMVPVFQITGPTNNEYNGTFCLPQVPLPANFEPKVGDNATIQVIELAQHGAALYNCADITFAEPEDVPEVNSTNCFNSTSPSEDIGFQILYATTTSLADRAFVINAFISLIVPLMMLLGLWTTWA